MSNALPAVWRYSDISVWPSRTANGCSLGNSTFKLPLNKAPGASTAKGTGINWPMMRYSDILLMLAEAENELNGPTEIAQNALRRVRQRAFSSTYWPTKVDAYIQSVSASKQSFFNAIVDERGWEFGGEMIRKYELIRWNLYAPKMKQMVDDLKLMADAAQTGTGKFSELPDYMFTSLYSTLV